MIGPTLCQCPCPLFYGALPVGSYFFSEFSGGTGVTSIGLDSGLDIDADLADKYLFYTASAGVKRINFDGTGVTTIVPNSALSDNGTAGTLAGYCFVCADTINKNIYFSTSHQGGGVYPYMNIWMCDYNGASLTKIIAGSSTFNTASPGGILGMTVDPTASALFWTGFNTVLTGIGFNSFVNKSDLSGGSPSTILSRTDGYYLACDVDAGAATIYMMTQTNSLILGGSPTDLIQSFDYSGGSAATVYTLPVSGAGVNVGQNSLAAFPSQSAIIFSRADDHSNIYARTYSGAAIGVSRIESQAGVVPITVGR